MNNSRYISLSVHDLVDRLLRRGDIDSRVYNLETMKMGSLLHASYQSKQGNDYLSEYPLKGEVETELGTVFLQGRADGIIVGGKRPIIDEIKSTVIPLEDFFNQQKEWHLGQALCYCYLYLKQACIQTEAEIHLTYLSQVVSSERMTKTFVFTFEEIEETVKGYVREFFRKNQGRFDSILERNASVIGLPFPFENFRKGQRQLSQLVYGISKKGGILFAEAPTGIGKTISTLYPAVLGFQDDKIERIFYLTAKTTGSLSAYEAVGALYEAGFKGRDSVLVGKEKICLCPGHACNPDDCPFAKDYYGKVGAAIEEAVSTKSRFDMATVLQIARKHGICSFEFQLDLSLQADIIIADYNYFFDPFVRLERYFDAGVDASRDLILVDEAHNLVDRSRGMYSAAISSSSLKAAKRSLVGPGFKKFRAVIRSLMALFPTYCESETNELPVPPAELETLHDRLRTAENAWIKENSTAFPKEYIEFRREFNRFVKLANEYYNSTFQVYAVRNGDDVCLHMLCMDPAQFVSKDLARVRGAVFFSATLSPVEYYQKALLGGSNYPSLLLPSPFPAKNLKTLIAPKISVRYKDREKSYEVVADYLMRFASAKVGNYFFYFPSYSYMEKIREHLEFKGCNVLTQSKKMREEDRLEFLASFVPNPEVTTIGLLVLGGPFAEGIDLPDDRLIGVAIVGVGLPMVCYENNRLKAYYDEKEGDGFSFAYLNPGINKFTQAVGRLIRTETDVGAALLIDDRYLRGDYVSVVKRLWPNFEILSSPEEVAPILSSFYKSFTK
ncbi:MAG: helicase C-terminal domain-containing protein [Candidatus Enteromonas sp.]|nr:helicase C-terminal domain-containing protein [Candidatus Enteromonas sp.]